MWTHGGALETGNVDRSTGLAIYFPAPGDSQPGDLEEYGLLRIAQDAPEWVAFVSDFLEAANGLDQASSEGNFILATCWTDPLGNFSRADVDLYIMEPDDVYAPWMGETTPNGSFSPDSIENGLNYEVYTARDRVQPGLYWPLINFYVPGPLGESSVLVYAGYLPTLDSTSWIISEPREMGLWWPAPEVWDDIVIAFLSANAYSDWWIPPEAVSVLAQASATTRQIFWEVVRARYNERHQATSGVPKTSRFAGGRQ